MGFMPWMNMLASEANAAPAPFPGRMAPPPVQPPQPQQQDPNAWQPVSPMAGLTNFVGPPKGDMTPPAVMQEASSLTPPPAVAAALAKPRGSAAPAMRPGPAATDEIAGAISQLNSKELDSLKQQGLTVEGLKKQLGDLRGKDLPLDLTGLAALTDAWSGSNFAGSYRPSETAKDRQATVEKLQAAISGGENNLSEREINLLKDQLGSQFQVQGLNYKKEQDTVQNKLEQEKIDIMREAKAGGLTKGQEAVDKAYGQTYADYVANGGSATALASLGELHKIRDKLANMPNATGPAYGVQPDAMKKITSPEAFALQESVAGIVQKSMKEYLGNAFTAKEGEQVLARAYNPSLPVAENLRRLDNLEAKLAGMARAKQASADYFEINGTLKGFKGKNPSVNDLLSEEAPTTAGGTRAEKEARLRALEGSK